MLRIVHKLSDLPMRHTTVKTAILDLSDDGKVGYQLGYSPETLPSTMYNTLFVHDDKGYGLYHMWDTMLDTTKEKLILLNNPLRMCDIHHYVATDVAHGTTNFKKILQSLVNYLKKKEYEDIWILCGESEYTLLMMHVITQIK